MSNRVQSVAVVFCAVVLWGSLCTERGPAQTEPGPSPQASETLNVKVREVALDVVVTDKAGHVVTRLDREDFRLFEDGVEQTIRGFVPPAEHAEPAGTVVHSSADLNYIGDAPVTILVLDELNTRFEDSAYAREALERYLLQQPAQLTQPTLLMVANDRKTDVLVDYTQDRSVLLKAVKQHVPALAYLMEKGGNNGADANERMIRGLGALVQIAEASEGTAGRKNIIWVGDGFPAINTDATNVNAKRADELNEAVRRATQLLMEARVTVNLINPSGMTTGVIDSSQPDITTPQDIITETQASGGDPFPGNINFSDFALATGGSVYRLRNDVQAAIANAVQTSADYFTLTYSPKNESDDPAALRKIRVVMRDPNLLANTRTGYYKVQYRSTDVRPPAPDTRRLAFDLTNAALSSTIYNGVAISVQRSGNGYELLIPTNSLAAWTRPDGKPGVEITLMTACFDSHKHVLAHAAMERTSTIPAEQAKFFRFTIPVKIPNHTTRLRFVVRDAVNGKIGTADVTVN